MDLPIIEMDRNAARRAFLEYKRAVEAEADREIATYVDRVEERRRELAAQDAALMRGYRHLSVGRQIISLRDAIVNGGFDDRGRPNIAVANASDKRVRMVRAGNGRITFTPHVAWPHREPSSRSPRVYHVDGPRPNAWLEADAIIPTIPPRLRPATLGRYAILWEADWRSAPKDPALLRPLGGGLYAVVATWDLTDLERTVLGLSR